MNIWCAHGDNLLYPVAKVLDGVLITHPPFVLLGTNVPKLLKCRGALAKERMQWWWLEFGVWRMEEGRKYTSGEGESLTSEANWGISRGKRKKIVDELRGLFKWEFLTSIKSYRSPTHIWLEVQVTRKDIPMIGGLLYQCWFPYGHSPESGKAVLQIVNKVLYGWSV